MSILHRISGVVLIAAFALFLYLLHFSLASPQDFGKVIDLVSSLPSKLVIWAMLSALAYHSIAGIRHLIMDLGVGETLKGGVQGAQIALLSSAVLIVAAFFWVMSW